MKIHAYTLNNHMQHRTLNSMVCGHTRSKQGFYTTGHGEDVTCKNCLRIIRKQMYRPLYFKRTV